MNTDNSLSALPPPVGLARAHVSRDELQKAIDLIAAGSNHKEAAATISLTASSLHAEIQRDAGLRAAYGMARKARGALHAARVQEIATDVWQGRGDAKRGKVAMDANMWLAGRYDPAAWGDRQIIQHEEAPKALSADELRLALLALAQLAGSRMPGAVGPVPDARVIESEAVDLTAEILGT